MLWIEFTVYNFTLAIIFRIYGSFDLTTRLYIIRDPDAYKRIAIKEFDHFEDHRSIIDETMDDIWGNTLISLRGEKWRQMRATLSPAFTGSKMRQMFVLVSECADEIVQHFTKKSLDTEDRLDIEMKDFFSRYTNDVIATCAFGIKVNSFSDPNNEFYSNGIKVMKFGGFTTFAKFLFALIMPKAAKYLKISAIDQTVSDSFRKIVLDTMEMRKKNNIYRPDMINIMMQVREGSLQHAKEEKSNEAVDGFAAVEESEVGKMTNSRKWTDNEIVAQCILFFLAGFETSSTVLTFAAYELVVNPDVQQKLYEEIAEVDKQLGGTRVSYDALQKMKYLDQFISETLRMWPAAFQTDRICVKDYIFDDGNLKFKIEKGSNVIFSIVGVQRDPKFFPQPDKFDPERFNDANKHNIRPGTYTPFGEGPRNCIGELWLEFSSW